ncbi:MAG: CHAT domain-containing protein [Acidobacteriota bacterium]
MADRGDVPDLVMRVVERKDPRGTCLLFTLVSPGGGQRDILGRPFEGDAEAFRDRLLGTLSSLVSARKLDGLGRYLWRELFPPELQSAYREFRTKITSWMILSDEPWIPWELVKPYSDDGSGEPFDDDFLGLAFQLTRWLVGDLDPARRIAVTGVVGLRTDRNLPLAAQETAFLEGLASARGVRAVDRFVRTSDEIVAYLGDPDFQLLHLVGHGRRSGAKWEAGLPLEDDEIFVPSELEGPISARLRRKRPMVFLNACWAGHETRSLTHLAGWAPTWIQVCGCGAFVAPIWPVRDSIACRFSEELYQALAEGRSLGEAAQQARRSAFSLGDAEPSALAYAVYGLPGARVVFGVEAVVGDHGNLPLRPQIPSRPEAPARSGRRAARRIRSTLRVKKIWLPLVLVLVALAGVRFGKDFILSPKEESFGSISVGRPLPKPKPKPPAPAKPTTLSVGTTGFVVRAASGVPKSTLASSLRRAAANLEEAGLAGWSIQLDVAPPQVTAHSLSGFPEQSCRLVAHGRARRAGTAIDLGSIEAVNSQGDRATACAAAARDLGTAVIYKLASSIRKEVK